MWLQPIACRRIIDGILRELVDDEYRDRVWINGRGPEVSSPGEFYCDIEDAYMNEFLASDIAQSSLPSDLRSKLSELWTALEDANYPQQTLAREEILPWMNGEKFQFAVHLARQLYEDWRHYSESIR